MSPHLSTRAYWFEREDANLDAIVIYKAGPAMYEVNNMAVPLTFAAAKETALFLLRKEIADGAEYRGYTDEYDTPIDVHALEIE